MDELDLENAALEAQIAELESKLAARSTATTGGSLLDAISTAAQPVAQMFGLGRDRDYKQLAFDVPVGITRAVTGTADVLAYPFVKGANLAGADVEPWGATRMLDALIESDKGLPGPGAAEILGVKPDTETQKAVSFVTPTLAGKGQALKEAILGGVSYLGSKLGETTGSPVGEAAGAILAPLSAQGGLRLAQKTAPSIVEQAKFLAGNEDAVKRAAQAEILRAAGDEGTARLELAQALGSTDVVPPTAAEIVRTPSMAVYQNAQALKQSGQDILNPAREARKVELDAALSSLGVKPEAGEFSTILRDKAELAAEAKAKTQQGLLESLGYSPANVASKRELGESLQKATLNEAEDAYAPVRETWKGVKEKTKMDIAPQLSEAVDEFGQFDTLTKKRMSSVAKDTIGKARELLYKQDGLITVKDFQALRASANAALRMADSTTDSAEISLMRRLKNKLDSIDETAIPDATNKNELEPLARAIAATKQYYQTFGTGVIKDIIKKKGGQLSLQASQIVDRAFKSPENAEQIVKLFGRGSEQATLLRNEMLDRLSKQSNPTEYIGRNKDVFKAVFDSDYSKVVQFAQGQGQKTGFEQYARITDSAIPRTVFASERDAKAFMARFKDTELPDFARGKFIESTLLKRGASPLDNLQKNKKVAQALFPDTYDKLEKALSDIEKYNAPNKLEKLASKGAPLTAQRLTALGEVMRTRGLIAGMKGTGKAMTAGSAFALVTGNIVSGAAGLGTGYALQRIGTAREAQMDRFVAEMLANPQLLDLATAAPTKENVESLIKAGSRLGIFGGRAAAMSDAEDPSLASDFTMPTEDDGSIINPDMQALDDENAVLEAQIAELEGSIQAPAVKIGKQNISIPSGEGYAPPKLVKAVMAVESANNPNAQSSKGALGLMQLMPATAKELGVDPKDANQNVEGGSRYLQQMLNRFEDVKLALAAYNWGQGNVNAAIKKIKAEGEEPTWENVLAYVKVPQETRQYVNKVMSKI